MVTKKRKAATYHGPEVWLQSSYHHSPLSCPLKPASTGSMESLLSDSQGGKPFHFSPQNHLGQKQPSPTDHIGDSQPTHTLPWSEKPAPLSTCSYSLEWQAWHDSAHMHSDTALTNFEEKLLGWERTQEAHTTHLNWMLRTGASVKSDIHSMLTTCCTCAPPSTVGSTGLVCRFRCECVKESRQTGRVGPAQPAHHRKQQGP